MTAEDRAHIVHFDYNDVESLEAAAAEAGNDLAGVLVSAFRHDVRRDQEMPTPAFAEAARAVCDRAGAALILDEVRAGFRLDARGSWEALGVRPDLCAWSKAIANGYPLAAVTGTERLRAAAQEIFVTGSRYGIGLRQSGPPQMPLVLFDDDADLAKGNLFASVALEHGVYLHPWHNMFLSLAHTEADIDLALDATDRALAVLAARSG